MRNLVQISVAPTSPHGSVGNLGSDCFWISDFRFGNAGPLGRIDDPQMMSNGKLASMKILLFANALNNYKRQTQQHFNLSNCKCLCDSLTVDPAIYRLVFRKWVGRTTQLPAWRNFALVWYAPETDNRERKRLLAHLIKNATLTRQVLSGAPWNAPSRRQAMDTEAGRTAQAASRSDSPRCLRCDKFRTHRTVERRI